MIINTITCHHVYNHGALLQAYALAEYLKGEGHDVSIIDYRPPYLDGHFKFWRCNSSRFNRMGLGWAYVLAKLPGRMRALKRKKAFDTFFKIYMPVTKQIYHSIDELRANPPKADMYIAGSDQIWNTSFPNGKDPSFYLDFGNAKKISYAASFATSKLHIGTDEFVKKELNNFDSISVREYSGKIILNQLGFNGEVVVDPVFLLDIDKWNELYNGCGENENFILTYDFDKRDNTISNIAKVLAKEYNCKIFSIGPVRMSYADKSYTNYGPDTFLSLIRNARCVISNSFHGTAFSMIYKKNFFVVNRKDGLNVRMRDLLSHYGILERMISPEVDIRTLISDIDYICLYEKLKRDILSSKNYLKQVL